MNLKLKKRSICLAVFTVLFLISLSYAEPFCEGKGGPGGPRGEMIDELVKELDLTPEQRASVEKQCGEHREKNKEIGDKLRAKMDGLKEELEKKDTDRAKIDTFTGEIKNLQGELTEQRIGHILAVKAILTPEQFEKLQEKKKMQEKKRSKRKSGFRKKVDW